MTILFRIYDFVNSYSHIIIDLIVMMTSVI